jgi:hypothetical protein
MAASPGFCSRRWRTARCPVSETDALLITLRGNWSLGKVLPLRFLGVGQT